MNKISPAARFALLVPHEEIGFTSGNTLGCLINGYIRLSSRHLRVVIPVNRGVEIFQWPRQHIKTHMQELQLSIG